VTTRRMWLSRYLCWSKGTDVRHIVLTRMEAESRKPDNARLFIKKRRLGGFFISDLFTSRLKPTQRAE